MRSIWIKRSLGVLGLGLAIAGIVWIAWPNPIPVDFAVVTKGPMEVTVDDEAKTSVREVYTVSAPVSGKLLRIARDAGDPVIADETVVAVMQPVTPAFHDASTHEQLLAAAAAADAAEKLAEAEVRRIAAALDFARKELGRAQELARTDTIAVRTLDKARFDAEANAAALASAKAQLDVRRSERASVAARLIDPSSVPAQSNSACCIQIRSPVAGRVLRILQESETIVQAGAPLIEIGDPQDIEVVAELLSTDAVQITPGAPVRIDGWGGPAVRGKVRRIDPAGFVKISALGIEEQRVRTWIDFTDPYEKWQQLGHDYRVIVHVTIWQDDGVLTAPAGAFFRKGNDWAVFAIRDGRARSVLVTLGQRNNQTAQILSGLSEGDKVVLHPSDRISEGVAVAQREVQ
jgi:HlyD family secretion protein